jgi:acetyl esterase/lipase
MMHRLALMALLAPCLTLPACGWVGKTPVAHLFTTPVAHFQRRVVYARLPGKRLYLDVFWPEGRGPFPMVVNLPGGAWYKADEEWMREPMCRWLCNNGFVVFNVSYRLAPKHKFPDQVNDALGAILFAKTNAAKYNGDPARVAIMGDSSGGNLAALAALVWDDPAFTPSYRGDGRLDARPQAVVLLFGIYDMVWLYNMVSLYTMFDNPKTDAVQYLGGTPEEQPDRYRRASPIQRVRSHRACAMLAPTLIVCGSADPTLPQARMFHEKLDEVGAPNALYISVGDTHSFTMFPPPFTKGAEDCYNMVHAFLDLELPRRAPYQPIGPSATHETLERVGTGHADIGR